tara:strand:+ start:414 stop:809 length:396 start_codon:yes stop_codon:yes gene_type:complete
MIIVELFVVSPFSRVLRGSITEGSFTEILEYLTSNEMLLGNLLPVVVAITIMTIAYFTLFEFKYQQTIGKMIFKIKVVSLQKKLTIGACVVRALVVLPFYFVTLIDVIYALFNAENQRVLEYFTKTKTVVA